MSKLLTALLPNRQVLLEIREDNDKGLAHINFDSDTARVVAKQLIDLADMADAGQPEKVKN